MPNHVTSRVIMRGPKEELRRFESTLIGKDENGDLHLDFEKVIPIPPGIKETDSNSSASIGYDAWYGSANRVKEILQWPWVAKTGATTRKGLQKLLAGQSPQYKIGADQYKRNLEKYGFRDAYDWHVAKWGTKWNSYHFYWVTKRGPKDWSPLDTSELEFTFDTAWSPPEPVFDAVAERFPELEIEVYCYDEGSNFACHGFYSEGGGSLICGDATDELYEKVYGEPPPPTDPTDTP